MDYDKPMDDVTAALMDAEFHAGARAGWNAAHADDPRKAFAALDKTRHERLSILAMHVNAAPPGPTARIQVAALAKLKALLADLPPPPWTFSPATTNKGTKGGQSYFAAQVWRANGTDLGFYSSEETGNADSTLMVEAIAALRNLAPGLIAEVEAGKRLREAMIKRHVQRTVAHGPTGARWGNDYVCDFCGIRASTPELVPHTDACPLR